jgi:hypothetical protein
MQRLCRTHREDRSAPLWSVSADAVAVVHDSDYNASVSVTRHSGGSYVRLLWYVDVTVQYSNYCFCSANGGYSVSVKMCAHCLYRTLNADVSA